MNLDARNHFSSYIKGKNIMTPDVEDYYWVIPGRLSAELAEGRGLSGNLIYGVSLSEAGVVGESKLCHSYKEALDYIKALQEEAKAF